LTAHPRFSAADLTVAGASPKCHLCGGASHDVVREAGPFSILRCRACGLCFLSPQPQPEETLELYSEHYFQSADGLARGYSAYVEQAGDLRATFRQRLRYLPKPGPANRLLDVGAAAGYFVEQARLAGWDAEGLEPSRWASAYAREQLRVPVGEGTLESAELAPASYDVVTFWEVIEHVPSPRDFLADVARVLKPGGTLFLSTPDSGSVVARLLGRRWLGWNKIPEHLFFFDRRSLIRLLDQAGFDVFLSRYVPLTVSWPYALERLGASLGLGAAAFAGPARVLRNRSVTVNCYYDLMLAARLRR
jgi:2-polyprenyl-3-methyl-5-hydroxy-6-metoxy-1,4-benzoquinol methylase